jgi:hypothetical protein
LLLIAISFSYNVSGDCLDNFSRVSAPVS